MSGVLSTSTRIGTTSEATKALIQEPVIFIDKKGDYWLNKQAQEFIAERGLPVTDILEWLKIGSTHLQNLSYKDIGFLMMHLPGNNVLSILRKKVPDEDNKQVTLTSREREILRHLVKGMSNKEIASLMKISPGTVNAHLDRIYMKLECTNRVAVCYLALKNGLFLPEGERLTKTSEHQ